MHGSTLNAEQQRAVESGDGPMLIVAGPGTGKTKTLTARIAYLVASKGVRPEQILALTFTNKAAQEMRERVQLALGKRTARQPQIATFHALCNELLGGELSFVTEPERLQVIKKLARTAQHKPYSARELGLLISRAKNGADDDPELAKLVQSYDKALAELNKLDFDDLLLRLRDSLKHDPAIRQAVQARHKYILVDEFQDTNVLQYELLQLLRSNDNLFVIGDPLQSIYGFRGASGSIFDNFRADFPDTTEITLHTNYRSAPEIVRLSNAVFAQAPQLQPATPVAGSVRAVQVLNEYSEAAWVLAEIQKAIGGGDLLKVVSDDDRSEQRTLRDFAILYRSRSAGRVVQKAVQDSGLPYQIVGDGSPYDHPQVQAIIALLRASLTSEQPAHEGFSETEWRAVLNLITQAEQASPHGLAERIVQVLGFESSTTLQQFLGSLVRFANVAAAVHYFDELAGQQFYDPRADAVTLLTIHASKGLEFPHVFLVGTEDDILPHKNANAAEEQRLFYVAITRAKHRLDILHAKYRAGRAAQLSQFARAIADTRLPKTIDPNLDTDQRRAATRAIKRSQQSLF
ncbi:MAG TPA: ATP-dependent helicase [Candidatus Saccharimonadales bacterium]|nr:ATP-dependent helicase [Candidatus Saccharimonadales bacterium]